MLTAGEDPLYVARRLVVVASEDVGLADSHALPLATATYAACQNIGMSHNPPYPHPTWTR
jgi:putative ATPase